MAAKKKASPTSEPEVPAKLRALLAKREEARALLSEADAVAAQRRAQLSKIKAQLLQADKDGVLKVSDVMRW